MKTKNFRGQSKNRYNHMRLNISNEEKYLIQKAASYKRLSVNRYVIENMVRISIADIKKYEDMIMERSKHKVSLD